MRKFSGNSGDSCQSAQRRGFIEKWSIKTGFFEKLPLPLFGGCKSCEKPYKTVLYMGWGDPYSPALTF
jgi:hypothetical protein